MNTVEHPTPRERRFIIEPEGRPDRAGMMLVTVEALKRIGGSGTIQEIDTAVVDIEGISEEKQAFMMPDGSPRLNFYMVRSRTYLKHGGAVENSARGVWALTETGKGISTITATEAIYRQVMEMYQQNARLRRLEQNALPDADAAITDDTDSTLFDDPADTWQDRLLSALMAMSPAAFERLAQRLLREAGFLKVDVRGKTGDGGLDGVGVLRVNLVSFKVFFQCKRWGQSVGTNEIRDFRGALQGRADKGLFITTSSFTKKASEEATRDGAIAIDLIDGERLCDLLKEYNLGVSTEQVEKVTIDETWFAGI